MTNGHQFADRGRSMAHSGCLYIGCLHVNRVTNLSFDLLIVILIDFKNYFAKEQAGFIKSILCKLYMRSFHNFAGFYHVYCEFCSKSTIRLWLSVLVLSESRSIER